MPEKSVYPSLPRCCGHSVVVYQIQFQVSKMLPRHSGRSNFLSNKSHITNHSVFKSSLLANNDAVFLSILLFGLVLAALQHLTEYAEINQSYVMSCYCLPIKGRQCSMKSINKRGHVCKTVAYSPRAHSGALHSVSTFSITGQQSLSDLPFRLIFVVNYSNRKSLWQTDWNVRFTQKAKGEIAQMQMTLRGGECGSELK